MYFCHSERPKEVPLGYKAEESLKKLSFQTCTIGIPFGNPESLYNIPHSCVVLFVTKILYEYFCDQKIPKFLFVYVLLWLKVPKVFGRPEEVPLGYQKSRVSPLSFLPSSRLRYSPKPQGAFFSFLQGFFSLDLRSRRGLRGVRMACQADEVSRAECNGVSFANTYRFCHPRAWPGDPFSGFPFSREWQSVIKATKKWQLIAIFNYLQFLFPTQILDPVLFLRRKRPVLETCAIYKFHRPTHRSVFRSELGVVMLFKPSFQICRYSCIKARIRAFKDIEVVHSYLLNFFTRSLRCFST